MDQLTDLREVEKEFGSLPLGHSSPVRELDDEEGKFSQFALKPVNKHWFQLAKVFNYGPSKMANFIEMVHRAVIESTSDFEVERRRSLEEFYKKKKMKRADD